MRDIMTRKEFHKRLLIASLLLGLVLPLANVPVTSSLIKELGGVINYQTRVIMLVRGEGGDTVEYLPTEYVLTFIHIDLPDF